MCLQLLRQAVGILDNIEDPTVLNEVVSHDKGKSYLKGAQNVYSFFVHWIDENE